MKIYVHCYTNKPYAHGSHQHLWRSTSDGPVPGAGTMSFCPHRSHAGPGRQACWLVPLIGVMLAAVLASGSAVGGLLHVTSDSTSSHCVSFR